MKILASIVVFFGFMVGGFPLLVLAAIGGLVLSVTFHLVWAATPQRKVG